MQKEGKGAGKSAAGGDMEAGWQPAGVWGVGAAIEAAHDVRQDAF